MSMAIRRWRSGVAAGSQALTMTGTLAGVYEDAEDEPGPSNAHPGPGQGRRNRNEPPPSPANAWSEPSNASGRASIVHVEPMADSLQILRPLLGRSQLLPCAP